MIHLFLEWDEIQHGFVVGPQDARAKAWMESVWDDFRDVLAHGLEDVMAGKCVVPEPQLGDAVPPRDVMTPSLVAQRIVDVLQRAYCADFAVQYQRTRWDPAVVIRHTAPPDPEVARAAIERRGRALLITARGGS